MVAIPGWKLFSGGGGPDTAVGGFNADADGLYGTVTPGNMNQPFTAIIWFKSTGSTGSIFELRDTGASGYNQLYLDGGGVMSLYSNTGSVVIDSTINNTDWYFAAITHSGAAWAMKGWCAKVGAPTLSQGSLTAVALATAYADVKLAYGYFGGEFLTGALRSYRLFDKEMTEAELNAERASSTPVNTANLINHAPLLTVATKLDTTVGASLTAAGAGSWTDVSGPF